MPAEPIITLHDQLWHALEFGFRTPPLVRTGNRLKLGTQRGWFKDFMAKAPADYPQVMIEIGRRGTHSAYNDARSFAHDEDDFVQQVQQGHAKLNIIRTETVDITCKADRTTIGTVANPGAPNLLKEAIVDDLMRSGNKLSLPALVLNFSGFTTSQRFTRQNEQPYPGQITVISFVVTMQEDGRESLAT